MDLGRETETEGETETERERRIQLGEEECRAFFR